MDAKILYNPNTVRFCYVKLLDAYPLSVALQQNLNHLYVIGVRSRAQINGALRFSIQLTLRILGDCS